MILVAMAPPAIIAFIILAVLIVYERILDFLNIPRSKLTYAKVIVKEDKGKVMGYRPHMRRTIFDNCYITFEIGNFQTIELFVPKKSYESVSVGSRGVLVHTKSRFRGFHVDKKVPDLIKPKKKSDKSSRPNKSKK